MAQAPHGCLQRTMPTATCVPCIVTAYVQTRMKSQLTTVQILRGNQLGKIQHRYSSLHSAKLSRPPPRFRGHKKAALVCPSTWHHLEDLLDDVRFRLAGLMLLRAGEDLQVLDLLFVGLASLVVRLAGAPPAPLASLAPRLRSPAVHCPPCGPSLRSPRCPSKTCEDPRRKRCLRTPCP